MLTKKAKVSFNKTGNYYNAKVIIPQDWLSALGITQEDREVTLELKKNKTLIIKK